MPYSLRVAIETVSHYGIPLFFIISGYLLSASFITLRNREPSWTCSYRQFFLRRFLRIYPAYLVSLVLLAWLTKSRYADVLMHALNIHNFFEGINRTINPVFWSLAVEFQWYLIAPFLIVFFVKYSWWAILSVASIFLLLSNEVRLIWLNKYFSHQLSFDELVRLAQDQVWIHLYAFVIGIIIYRFRKGMELTNSWRAILLLTLLILGYKQNFLARYLLAHEVDTVHSQLVFMYISHAFLGLTVYAFRNLTFTHISISYISMISYSLYIYHFPLLDFTKSLNLSCCESFAAYLILSVVVASISYRWIEAPPIRFTLKARN